MKCKYCRKKCKSEIAMKIHVGIKHLDIIASTIDKNRPEVYLDVY